MKGINIWNCIIKIRQNVWLEGFALGNGRMGAVIHGALDHEVLQLNEDTLWSAPLTADRPFPLEVVKQARELAKSREI